MPNFSVTGHRGNGAGPDENTAASFKAALQHGAARLETDVQLVNGELVLAHPPKKSTMTLRELLTLTDVPLVLHLKRRHFNPFHDRRVVRRLVEVLGDREGITISSVWPGTLRWIKRHYPSLRTMFNTWGPTYDLLFSHNLGVAEYNCWHRTTTRRTVVRAKKRHVQLSVFVVPASERNRQKFARLGITGVMTDRVAFFSGQHPAARKPRRRSTRGSGRS